MKQPKRAMVLAAGRGKRMRPLTATAPKPLIEVCGRALIDHALDALAVAEVEKAVVNVHYLPALMEAHLGKRTRAPGIVVSDERKQLLDTGGGIARALPELGSEPFYLMNSDSFWIEGSRPNLKRLADKFDEARMDAVLLLAPTVRSIGYQGRGDFIMDPDGALQRRDERDVAPFAYSGAAILHPRLFDDCPEGRFSLNVLFDRAIEAGRLHGVRMDGQWFHVGTPDAIGEAEMTIAESAA